MTTDTFATAYDTSFWTECIVGTGVVSISSGELKLDTPANNDIAALVSTNPHLLRNFSISVSNVDVATSAPARAGIVLAKTKTTTGNPEVLNDSIRIYLDAVNSTLDVITDVAATEKTAYTAAWTDGDGKLTVEMEPDGVWMVTEDAVLRRIGSNPLTCTSDNNEKFELYIYLYTIGLAGTLGYGLLDNFVLSRDPTPTTDLAGTGVKLNSMRNQTPVYGRLIDQSAQDLFETDTAYDGTPTQTITLSRDVKRFELQEFRAFMTSTNAVTSGISLYGDNQADNYHSYMTKFYQTGDNTTIAKDTWLQKTRNDTTMGAVANLDVPGQIYFAQDWSAAPGDTQGVVVVVGREVL